VLVPPRASYRNALRRNGRWMRRFTAAEHHALRARIYQLYWREGRSMRDLAALLDLDRLVLGGLMDAYQLQRRPSNHFWVPRPPPPLEVPGDRLLSRLPRSTRRRAAIP
jgi:hypothetical protein